MEQWNPQILFKTGNGLGQRRLRYQQMLCSAIEAIMIHNGQEILQLSRIHAVFLRELIERRLGQ
jgi:hypothetical protein